MKVTVDGPREPRSELSELTLCSHPLQDNSSTFGHSLTPASLDIFWTSGAIRHHLLISRRKSDPFSSSVCSEGSGYLTADHWGYNNYSYLGYNTAVAGSYQVSLGLPHLELILRGRDSSDGELAWCPQGYGLDPLLQSSLATAGQPASGPNCSSTSG